MTLRRRTLWTTFLLMSIIVMASLVKTPASRAETVQLPMNIDMMLLRALIVDQAYREPGERARVLVLSDNCNELWLHSPQVMVENGQLHFQTSISVLWGTPLAGNCYGPLQWEGSLVLWQQPQIDNQWNLTFHTLNSALLGRDGQPAKIAGVLWDLIKDHVHTYLGRVSISLAPPVENLITVLRAQADPASISAAERFLESIHPQQPVIENGELRVDILADVSLQAEEPGPAEEELTVSPEAQAKVIALWQTWDALLVNLIEQLSNKPLAVEDRRLLLDTMLAARYEFSEALDQQRLTTGFVRGQFTRAWRVLEPLFRRHLVASPGTNLLGYLSFFTAADALALLDRIGPSIGIDLSREGFMRLAHMLSNEPLNESAAVDARLRQVLGLDAPLAVPPPRLVEPEPEEAPVEQDPRDPATPETVPPSRLYNLNDSSPRTWLEALADWPIWHLLPHPAEAYAADSPSLNEVQAWTAELTPAAILLPNVQKVLADAAKTQRNRLDLSPARGDWFFRMMQATAWQESCFRQFIVVDRKITYLLSYNKSSVGLMQVNEKVWRGIYSLQDLRWNIDYNCAAGAEILALYLNRYIAAQKEIAISDSSDGRRYLAMLLYAMYNGGPNQLTKFASRLKAGKLYQSDKLFQQKYDQVQAGDWLSAVECLPAS